MSKVSADSELISLKKVKNKNLRKLHLNKNDEMKFFCLLLAEKSKLKD